MRQGRRKNVRKSQRQVAEKPRPPQSVSSTPGPLSPRATRILLIAATLVCLLPFIGKPFNIDDPLFIWTAKQIVQHPADPYGFSLVWYATEMPMSHVTKNPPLASYYAAMIGSWTNWSEVVLHLAFLLPAVVVVLGTYELARELTGRPLLATAVTLAAPGFLVSCNSVMCDIPMLALWMVCVLAWRKGLSSGRASYLLLSAFLIAVCALTKYFGACLIPLLLVYSIYKKRRLGYWCLYFLLPIAILIGYQLWSLQQYDEGLLTSAAEYAGVARAEHAPSTLGGFLTGLSFTGGCMLPVLLMAPLLFRRLGIAVAFLLAIPGAIVLTWNVLGETSHATNKTWLCANLALFITGGILSLSLAFLDFFRHRDAESMLLGAWVLGTFIFAADVNWTVNVRSILPLIPATAILIVRRLETLAYGRQYKKWAIALPVLASLALSLWLGVGDQKMASSEREAAQLISSREKPTSANLLFGGHWGFQYYMEEYGAQPVDVVKQDLLPGDILVEPENNANTTSLPRQGVALSAPVEIDVNRWIYPLGFKIGAGFYSSIFGPLPFAVGRVPPERYAISRVTTKLRSRFSH
jgi:hypothetical protein